MPYSYTQFSTFSKCRAKFKYKYIDRLRMPPKPASPAAARGIKIHQNIEAYLKRETEEVDQEINFYGPFLLALRETPILIEHPFYVTESFEVLQSKNDSRVAITGYIDAYLDETESLTVYEWKTGKVYDDHDMQRLLYGTVALALAPTKESVSVTSVYLDRRDNVIRTYYRSMMNEYIGIWQRHIKEIEDCTEFQPQPNYLCRYCEYSKLANNGPCPF